MLLELSLRVTFFPEWVFAPTMGYFGDENEFRLVASLSVVNLGEAEHYDIWEISQVGIIRNSGLFVPRL